MALQSEQKNFAKFKVGDLVKIIPGYSTTIPQYGIVCGSEDPLYGRNSMMDPKRKYYIFYEVFLNNRFDVIEQAWLENL